MKIIPLSQGKCTVVDDEDYEFLMQWKWYAAKSCYKKNRWYARRMETKNGRRKLIYMHRAITNAPDGLEPDHKDGNGLNNTRKNLVVGTHAENMWSYQKRKGSNIGTGYIGVCLFRGKKYQARLNVDGKSIYLGLYNTAEEAARVYDEAARKLRGGKITLNFPD